MSATTEKPNQIHQGRNIKRFREMLGLKQEALAYALGEEWSQKRVSLLEAKETIEEDVLIQVAEILKVPVDAIKNLDDNKAVNIIANTFNDEAVAYSQYYKCTINPMEKWLESLEEIKQLHNEIKKLYERLLDK
ncbi:helix-turn-helix transcriptional regulator [Mucilaginibacter sp. FT3.2]|jgi:transcriptional regulator with XRE-family HTH domain|uniref:helix-turn-helix transcriptional regulator n=1 Tax=Mucilaginibacter sp. FT3.2 TaxID=2723090 RepID=UPI00160DE1BC|nr:helix-turn-helix transcriptional regulator [Mucilaginibacter sp. FT3.2]MBB6233817.1 transcriptional regulator with XRE-family HTH domain [Mucilaginibacter sp. FT3.2]